MYNKIKVMNDTGTKIIDYMDDGYTRTRKSMNDRFTKSKIYNYQGTHIDIIISPCHLRLSVTTLQKFTQMQ